MKKNNPRLLIGTGWYSDSSCHQRYQERSKLTFEPNWLSQYWRPCIERFIVPDHYFILISNCEIIPAQYTFSDGNWEYVFGHDAASLLPHSHDFHTSIFMGLQYAACYHMDFLYIEQDCLVFGLDKVVAWANDHIGDKLIIYGYGNWSYQPGWAEQSLMFIPFRAIPMVINIMHMASVHMQHQKIPELLWHELFHSFMIAWPFGYGRHPVRNWDDPMFYRQQVSDADIKKFLKLGEK